MNSKQKAESKVKNPYALDYLAVASEFLNRPIRNTLRYYLARLLRRMMFFSSTMQWKIGKSVEKRDFREISDTLKQMPDLDDVAWDTKKELEDQDVFRHTQIQRRQSVLGSDWHVAICRCSSEIIADTKLPTTTLSFVTFNSERWLDGMFNSLLRQSIPLNRLNIHIVDHGSSDASMDKIQAFFEDHGKFFASFKLTKRENLGFGSGHDYVIQNSDDDFVLVSNVDVEFDDDTISQALFLATCDEPDVACWELRQCPYEHPKYYDPVTLETAWCSHACILLRRDAYMAVGGYDPKIFMYGEDVELSYRFRGAGYKLRYLPHVFFRHYVDFRDTDLRPNQLSGTVSSNILLRYRYLGEDSGNNAEEKLNKLVNAETNTHRQKALMIAQTIVDSNRAHFLQEHRPKHIGCFPFNGFDYDRARDGFDVSLDSMPPIENAPLVSIVTRTHGPNVALLREAIVSVLNQTYDNIEHLIVEDTTNFAEELVQSVADQYNNQIRYIRSDAAGRSNAGNCGLAAAKGDLLMFLDNDDLLYPEHVELLVRDLVAIPHVVASYSLAWDMPTFYSGNGLYREGDPTIPPAHRQEYSRERFKKGNFIPIQSILFRRQLYDELGGFDTQIDLLEDWNLWARYAEHGEFSHIAKLTSIYKTPGDIVFRESRANRMRECEETIRRYTFDNTEPPIRNHQD